MIKAVGTIQPKDGDAMATNLSPSAFIAKAIKSDDTYPDTPAK